MIKGCQKRIIQIKDTKSRVFEEAYFVLKNGASDAVSEKDIISEATSIINRYSQSGASPKRAKRSLKGLFYFLTGTAIGFILFLCIYLLFL